MPAYMVIHAVITNPAGFIEYAKEAGELIGKFGGTYVVRGAQAEVLEGGWPHNRRTVVSKWPSVDAAKAFWDSPEYQEVKKLREGAAQVDVALFDGIPV